MMDRRAAGCPGSALRDRFPGTRNTAEKRRSGRREFSTVTKRAILVAMETLIREVRLT